MARVNSDLIGKYVNIASRTAPFITKNFDGQLSPDVMSDSAHDSVKGPARAALKQAWAARELIRDHYDRREFGKALREVMLLADAANEYVNTHAPWERIKGPQDLRDSVRDICTVSLELFRVLTLYLKPVLPALAKEVEGFLNIAPLKWEHAESKNAIWGRKIGTYKHLMARVQENQLDALLEIEKEPSKVTNSTPHPATLAKSGVTPAPQPAPAAAGEGVISIDDFSKIDLRIAKIVNAEHVEGADKLLRLTLDVGALGSKQVFAGIKSAYDPTTLVGRLTVMVANLAPRKMKFGLSEGMVLAASGDTPGLFILSPDAGAQPGMKVK
jgi:methionyl-tRNA synthetase